MRKFFSMFFITICAFAICFAFNANYATAYADAVFALSGTTLVGFVSNDAVVADIDVPALIDGVAITKIEEVTGSHVSFSTVADTITSIDLSKVDSLEEIGTSVFKNCSNLAGELYLSPNLVSVGRYAFSGTKIDTLIVNNENEITLLSASCFPDTINKVVFSSLSSMENYLSNGGTSWSKYSEISTYKYNVQLSINGVINDSGIKQIKGDTFEKTFAQIQEYLSGYEIESIKQNDVDLTATSIASGDEIVVVTKDNQQIESSSEEVIKTYGDEIILSVEATQNATYNWTINGETIENNSNIFDCSSYDASDYTVVCETSVEDTVKQINTFNLKIRKAEYNFSFPTKALFEYYEFDELILITDQQKNDLTLTYSKLNNEVYEEVDEISIGKFKVEAELKEELAKNYMLQNSSFSFEIVNSVISISWGVNEFNYTGEIIKPEFLITGNTWGKDITFKYSADSVGEHSEVGKYNITIENINNQYFEFAPSTQLSFDWEIKQTTLIIKWELNEFNYTSQGVSAVAYGVNGDISIPLYVSEISTGNTTFTEANTYEVKAELPTGYEGFVLSGNNTSVCIINKTKLDASFVSRDNYVYNGQYVEILAEITTETLDEVNLILSGHYYKDAGKYIAKIEGVDNDNYYVDQITLPWEITAKPLAVTWFGLSVKYNGRVQVPSPRVNTGIDGETLELTLIADYTKNVNEDASQGYKAEAKLPEGVKNYSLTNTVAYYYITRALPFINVNPDFTTAYTGNNILPNFEFVGDEGALKIKIDGVETTSGVKEVGQYSVVFTSVKSQNYLAMEGEVVCFMTILPVEIVGKIPDKNIEVSAKNEFGFEIENLEIKEIENFDQTTLQSIAYIEDYKFVAAVNIGTENYSLNNVQILFSLGKKVPADKVRIFRITEHGYAETKVTVVDGKASIIGGAGQYLVLVEKQNWFLSPIGITTVSLSLLTVIIAIIVVYLARKPKEESLEKQVSKLLKKKIKEKISKGETVNEDVINNLRKEIEESLNKKN